MEDDDDQHFEESHISYNQLKQFGVYNDNYDFDVSGKIIRYGMTLQIIFEQKMEKCKNTLSLSSISPVLKLLPKIPRLEYKNPEALLIGYYSIKNMKIDKDELEKLAKKCEKNRDTISVTKADIIRYAKLIISLLVY